MRPSQMIACRTADALALLGHPTGRIACLCLANNTAPRNSTEHLRLTNSVALHALSLCTQSAPSMTDARCGARERAAQAVH